MQNFLQHSLSEYVELLKASRDSSQIYCKFRQKIFPGEEEIKAHIPNLNKSYTLLLAYGKTPDHKSIQLNAFQMIFL